MDTPIRFGPFGENVLVPIHPDYYDGMWEVLNACARNRDYMGRQRVKDGVEKEDGLRKWAAKFRELCTVGFVVLKRGVVIGYALINKTNKADTGVLGCIAILPRERGFGISHRLLRHTITEAQRVLVITKVVLQTFEHNQKAQRLYAQHGFVVDPKAKLQDREWYGHMLPRVQMVKVL